MTDNPRAPYARAIDPAVGRFPNSKIEEVMKGLIDQHGGFYQRRPYLGMTYIKISVREWRPDEAVWVEILREPSEQEIESWNEVVE